MAQNINLTIAERVYNFTIDNSNPKIEQACRRAVKMIDSLYKANRLKMEGRAPDDVLTILLFNFAQRLAIYEINKEEDTFMDDLIQLDNQLDSYIKKQPLQQQ